MPEATHIYTTGLTNLAQTRLGTIKNASGRQQILELCCCNLCNQSRAEVTGVMYRTLARICSLEIHNSRRSFLATYAHNSIGVGRQILLTFPHAPVETLYLGMIQSNSYMHYLMDVHSSLIKLFFQLFESFSWRCPCGVLLVHLVRARFEVIIE